jgi:hypothetical protein
MARTRLFSVAVFAASAVTLTTAQVAIQQQRDVTREQQTPAGPPATGAIIGTVIVADAGRALDGARVTLSGGGLRGSRSVYSGDDGQFAFMNLPAGEYNLSGSKPGYLSVSFGQRRPGPGQPGTPIQLFEGQQLKDLKLAIPAGSVITGIVFDERARPSIATPVRVMRWSMQSGERTLVSAGTATTDDRGMYRVYGLPPGSYLVAAMPRNPSTSVSVSIISADIEARLRELTAAGGMVTAERFVVSQAPSPAPPADEPATGYAPVYYPGSAQLAGAATIELGVSQERAGADLTLQRVPLARIDGQIVAPPGVSISGVQVRLINMLENAPGVQTFSARSGRDGTFSFSQVPPGAYRLSGTVSIREPSPPARGGGGAAAALALERGGRGESTQRRFWGVAETAVNGERVAVSLSLRPGMPVTGQVQFNGSAPPPTDLRRVRVNLSPMGESARSGAASVNASLDAAGRFTLSDVVPGTYRVRVSGVSGWYAAQALASGRDALDFALEVAPDTPVSGVHVTMTDRTTELSGRIQDASARPAPDYTVLVFPSDRRYWVPQSRRILTTRPATDGSFSFSGLPPGDYRLAALGDVEPGAWYDPTFLGEIVGASVPVTLASGDRKTQSLQVR